jgi:hypothetical protein
VRAPDNPRQQGLCCAGVIRRGRPRRSCHDKRYVVTSAVWFRSSKGGKSATRCCRRVEGAH